MLQFEPYLSAFPEELRAYWQDFPIWMWLAWGITTWGGLLGSIALLLRHRWAVSLFWASALDAAAALLLGQFIPRPEGMDDSSMSLLVVAIAFAMAGYSVWMKRRGTLR